MDWLDLLAVQGTGCLAMDKTVRSPGLWNGCFLGEADINILLGSDEPWRRTGSTGTGSEGGHGA